MLNWARACVRVYVCVWSYKIKIQNGMNKRFVSYSLEIINSIYQIYDENAHKPEGWEKRSIKVNPLSCFFLYVQHKQRITIVCWYYLMTAT